MKPDLVAATPNLRQQLGIPDDARQVLIFAESSHWDPSWLYTSEEYFQRWVNPNLDAAINALRAEPRRVYGVECMFFLRLYWERRPERRELVRTFVNNGQLRLTSSGVTTPDTIIPSAEALLRDFLLGQEWLRANGMTAEPRLAYFTDSFGATPALPTILCAAGFDRTAISRIDGMLFVGADYESSAYFPRPGSSAELLLTREHSVDFIWRDMNGAEVLCHWNPFTYGQGDMLASRGIVRIYLFPLAVPDSSEKNVAHRIGQYVAQLAPISRTPFMLCPIGFDFNPPIPDLPALLDRYNRFVYPTSGIWAVNAGLDDYLALVECYRDQLPVVQLDPNPYWTGFYTARPSLKQQHRTLVETLLLAERLSLLPNHAANAPGIAQELAGAWWDAAATNHHDCITGTSPDRVVEAEQRPWIERAQATAAATVTRLAAGLTVAPTVRSSEEQLPEWRRVGGRLEISTPYLTLELSEDAGGAITACRDTVSGQALFAGPANDLISYDDSGGLWRMGHEYRGGQLKQVDSAGNHPVSLLVAERRSGLEVSCTSHLDGEPITRRLWLTVGEPVIRMRIEGRAAPRRTITVSFTTGLSADVIMMDVPGGIVERPWRKVYDPTFWAFQSCAHLQDRSTGRGMALFFRQPGALAMRHGGRMELVALRNATRELAFGFLPLPATPATGYERFSTAVTYTLRFTPSGNWRQNEIPGLAYEQTWIPWEPDEHAAQHALAASIICTDREDVVITAVKAAARGTGVIVRLTSLGIPAGQVALTAPGRTITGAWSCDARERDLTELVVGDGVAQLDLSRLITTVRLILADVRRAA